jgi:hypothetical protein
MFTNDEIMEMLKTDDNLNKARQIFSSYSAKIEQAQAQRNPPSPVEIRGMEFEAVMKIGDLMQASGG